MADSAIRELTDVCSDLLETSDPLTAVKIAQQITALSDRVQHEVVRAARQQGVSWSKIGSVFGLSKQGAQQRFGKHKAAPAVEDSPIDQPNAS